MNSAQVIQSNNSFSVVMAIWDNDVPKHLIEAFNSILNQSLQPSEIILVVDGPVKKSLKKCILSLAENEITSILWLPVNKGAGVARNYGIRTASFDYVAIMDADDISLNTRFEKQMNLLTQNSFHVVGGWISEFDDEMCFSHSIRKVPKLHKEIKKFSNLRSPMNNVTVMFEKNFFLQVGGYGNFRVLEDYCLFLRLLKSSAKFHNIQQVLVNVRGGDNMINRRSGLNYMINELKIIIWFYNEKYLPVSAVIKQILIKLFLRLLPKYIIRFIYKKTLRN